MLLSALSSLISLLSLFSGSVFASPIPDVTTENSRKEDAYIVRDLPGIDDIPESLIPVMHAGQLALDSENDTGLFFWRFGKNSESSAINNATTDDLVIWFNGGPGCSSLDGAMMEIGPFRTKKDDASELTYNNGTWLKYADLLFIDQPAGTGFAYTDVNYDTELTEASEHIVEFFKSYFSKFPSDRRRNIWIAGESYAGQYIPYFADAILREKKKNLKFQINLAGLLIGNGWVEPDIQSLSYVPFAMNNNLINKTNPMLPKLLAQHEKCQNAINDPDNKEFEKSQCDKVLDVFSKATRIINDDTGSRGTCYNYYDYRKQDVYPACGSNWPEILPSTDSYLNRKEVQKSLNIIHEKKWAECDEHTSMLFSPRKSVKSFELIPQLLADIPIMLFNGDKDIICNHLGTEMMIQEMIIGNEQKGFSNNSHYINWIQDGIHVGNVRSEMNLTYVRVFNSSHMVPYDLPEVSRGLLDIMFGLDELQSAEDRFTTTSVNTYVSSGKEQYSAPAHGSSKTSWIGVKVTLIGVTLIAALFLCLYLRHRNIKKSSFLESKANRKRKRVHWEDGNDMLDDDDISDDDSEHDLSSGAKYDDQVTSDLNSNLPYNKQPTSNILNTVLSKLGYNRGNIQYERVAGHENSKDIEMGDISDDQLVPDSEDDAIGNRQAL